MIVATRIPMLTERMYRATVEAAEAARQELPGGAPAREMITRLERLGYRVRLAHRRRAA